MVNSPTSGSDIDGAARKLLAYCRATDWAGYDPYDALNSSLFKALPALDSRIPRLVMTQLLKRSPINVRPLLLIPKTQNPKGIALFLSAVLKVPELIDSGTADPIDSLVETLVALRSPDTPYWCWGYSFPWQTRTIVVPRGSPNLVCTTFVAGALLDLYEQRREARFLDMAVSAAEYILNELYWTGEGPVAGLSYPLASVRARIHNANFLGAALFCRIYRLTGERKFVEPALTVARYSARRQHDDGSWPYGEAATQQWADNFHTGYNLCALKQIDEYLENDEFESAVRKGYSFYRAHFFREDGAARYFQNHTYPIDIHCIAQSIITLLEFKRSDPDGAELAQSVFEWAMKHMWSERGFFYYRVLRLGKIRTSYMRWSQAWMLLALATLLRERRLAARTSEPAGAVTL
jgi:rhamnogalacturonyl hydrolase YesR